MAAKDRVDPAVLKVADAVGALIEGWGFKRNMGRMWTVLYLEDHPIRSRNFTGLNMTDKVDAAVAGNQRDTQTRIRIDVNAKAGDVKGKLQFESDFGTGSSDWGQGFEKYSVADETQSLGFRE